MYTIAIDLGGTVVKIGLLSDGEIVDCVRLPSGSGISSELT